METQVKEKHYKNNYVNKEKFQLYYFIYKTVIELNLKSVLEIGIGPGVVANLLKFNRLNVVTCDFAKYLSPDVLCDIRSLPFKNNSFDIVIASQILEHIPFGEMGSALDSLFNSTTRYILLTLPYNRHNFIFYFKVKINNYLYFRGMVNRFLDQYGECYFQLGVRPFLKPFKFDGEHYWEIGYKEYPIERIRTLFSSYGKILLEKRVPFSPYHYAFLLEKQ